MIHLKVFGSVCFKHVPDAKRIKLDDRSRVILLGGYHSTSAYKLYYPVTNKLDISRDVIVKESGAWDWSKSQSNSSELTSEDTLKYEGSKDES